MTTKNPMRELRSIRIEMAGLQARLDSIIADNPSLSARDSPNLTTAEAANWLRLSPRTLEKWRVLGGGPRFRKFGADVVYALSDLQVWSDGRICETTSDPIIKLRPRGFTKQMPLGRDLL
jgi:hypothetical protein